MKPVDVKLGTCINSSKEINGEDPKFKIGDIARISKYKSIFAKDYVPNWSEEVFVIKTIKNTVPWTYFSSDCDGDGIVRTFFEKDLQKNILKTVWN